MIASASGTYEDKFERGFGRGRCGGRLSRNPWSVWEVGAMVAGFIIFWPLGLLALFLKWKNGEMWRGASEAKAPWSGLRKPDFAAWKHYRHDHFGGTGNAAFDDYRKAALDRLEEERRKLEEEGRAFRDFLDKLRRAKDQDEFDRFMAERQRPQPEPGASA